MLKSVMMIILGLIASHSYASTAKNITINNKSTKPVYYGVMVNYRLTSTPNVWIPRNVDPSRSDNLHLEINQNDAVIDVLVIENNGSIDEISKLDKAKPICEFSAIQRTDSSLPLAQVDLNNFPSSNLHCRVDVNQRTLTIY